MNPGGLGCSEQRSHHCTPAWATEPDSVSKKKNKNKTKKKKKKKLRSVYKIPERHQKLGKCEKLSVYRAHKDVRIKCNVLFGNRIV